MWSVPPQAAHLFKTAGLVAIGSQQATAACWVVGPCITGCGLAGTCSVGVGFVAGCDRCIDIQHTCGLAGTCSVGVGFVAGCDRCIDIQHTLHMVLSNAWLNVPQSICTIPLHTGHL